MTKYRSQPSLTPKQERFIIVGAAIIVSIIASIKLFNYLANSYLYQSSERASRATIAELNIIRAQYGRQPIVFDERVFQLATARVKDLFQYGYYDHVNLETGTCAYTMKTEYGLQPDEYVAENLMGFAHIAPLGEFLPEPMTNSLDPWMRSRGHRYNLLYADHVAGAIACYDSNCIFLGLNRNRFGEGCHTAAEGHQYWDTAPPRPGEVQF